METENEESKVKDQKSWTFFAAQLLISCFLGYKSEIDPKVLWSKKVTAGYPHIASFFLVISCLTQIKKGL